MDGKVWETNNTLRHPRRAKNLGIRGWGFGVRRRGECNERKGGGGERHRGGRKWEDGQNAGAMGAVEVEWKDASQTD